MNKETLTKGWHDVREAALVPLLRQSSIVKYEANFLCLLQTVLDQDSTLFSDDERAFLSTSSSLFLLDECQDSLKLLGLSI